MTCNRCGGAISTPAEFDAGLCSDCSTLREGDLPGLVVVIRAPGLSCWTRDPEIARLTLENAIRRCQREHRA